MNAGAINEQEMVTFCFSQCVLAMRKSFGKFSFTRGQFLNKRLRKSTLTMIAGYILLVFCNEEVYAATRKVIVAGTTIGPDFAIQQGRSIVIFFKCQYFLV